MGAIELTIGARARDLGGFTVGRVLPAAVRRRVGPFTFLDHMGPVALAPGEGMDVAPHPHIGLATLTWLFEGELVHRDSLGSDVTIRPGDVNWMMAGRGVAHSERSSPAARQAGPRLHGLQSWVALPVDHEEDAPTFEHHPAATLPRRSDGGVELTVVAGTAYGLTSPVSVLTPTLYVAATLAPGAALRVDDTHEERAVYAVDTALELDGETLPPRTLALLSPGPVDVRAPTGGRAMLLGGAHLPGERHMFWNFVSSDPARLERAKVDWRAGRWPRVVGDDAPVIPLPEH